MFKRGQPANPRVKASSLTKEEREGAAQQKLLKNLVEAGLVSAEPRASKRKKAVESDSRTRGLATESKGKGVAVQGPSTAGPVPSTPLGAAPPAHWNASTAGDTTPTASDVASTAFPVPPTARYAYVLSPADVQLLSRPPNLQQSRKRREAMFAAKARDGRHERNFVGSICAPCEEPLEHMLRGERILQLSCGHVSHEACFYEYIKEFKTQTCPTCDAPLGIDTSRGGNIDFDNLNKLARSVQVPDSNQRLRDTQATPVPWESHASGQRSESRQQQSPLRPARDHLLPEQVQRSGSHDHASNPPRGHHANGDAYTFSAKDPAEPQSPQGRRHDYDIQSMETALDSPRHVAKNPIPEPTVTVRSEFPTINKSRHQQSLTCLVTVEVVEGKWQPHPQDFRASTAISSTTEDRYEQRQPAWPKRARIPRSERMADGMLENVQALEEAKDNLFARVDNWHGLDCHRFGRLLLHGMVRVGKDRQSWQDLECYLFSEMLICVKEKKAGADASQQWDGADGPKMRTRCTLKGSILIKKHLNQVESVAGHDILTLTLSVAELPTFHLHFRDRSQLELWRKALLNIDNTEPLPTTQAAEFDPDTSATDDEHYPPMASRHMKRISSALSSSQGGPRSRGTLPTEYSNSRSGFQDYQRSISSIHVPIDIVVVIPVTPAMHGLKVNLLRDSLRFLVASLGERDRMGLVTFGTPGGGVPLVSMADKQWGGWGKVIDSIRPLGNKTIRADVAEGANAAMDLLMQRKSSNPLSHILMISDSAAFDPETVDFVVSRAEAAKIGIHSFGLGLTHRPDTLVELSTRTKASYTFVKDWMMLRECLAGCLGSLQSTSHQNVRLKLRLPEGSPARLVKVSGALQVTKRATGRDAEALLGDLRFGDKRDILVQLVIEPDSSTPDSMPLDPWENIISNLEALGPLDHEGSSRAASVEELPLIQADLNFCDILREGHLTQLSRPSLLAITMLPSTPRRGVHIRADTPPIPPHPSVVQRRMELLTSDMLSRALNLVVRGQNDRASHLLTETRSILKGLGKGGLPALPTPPPSGALPPTPHNPEQKALALDQPGRPRSHSPSPPRNPTGSPFSSAQGIDSATLLALDADLQASLEWILHPAVFARDSRKAVLQTIGVVSSQRGYTFRTPSESLWAARVPGVRRLTELSREWREASEQPLAEER